MGGAKIYLKREDLLHTGAHKINNALGQGLLARRMGKKRIIAETGAGQHGVATATVCALLGLECVVYMGDVDMARQELNVLRMRLLGAEVRGVSSGSKTLKDAISEAMRDWVTNVRTTYYLLGSALGGASLSDDGAGFSALHQPRDEGADSGARGAAADGGDCLRGRRIECDWGVLRVFARPRGAADWRGGRRARDASWASTRRASGAASREFCRGRIRMFCRMRMGRLR